MTTTQAETDLLAAAAKVAEAPATRGFGDSAIKLGSSILLALGRLQQSNALERVQALLAEAAALRDTLQQAVTEVVPPPKE